MRARIRKWGNSLALLCPLVDRGTGHAFRVPAPARVARTNDRKKSALASGVDLRISIVHTVQHYDENMSEVFFRELAIPKPDQHLEVGSGSHTEQTAKITVALEKVLQVNRPEG